eukprot:CAMPEP_0195283262 /NCGR_PEP_ID=MMETSP0707-20130614/1864_1 /TAXON_ID=33640 /ORGANISM="Asterionellopsis glacialis, Strain CCMP134" /LENGTH=626 /DNA_ID=CAMNT_0040342395 /DNA_START=182 /DNA_END=2059 /DNA_ORIENTATION=+
MRTWRGLVVYYTCLVAFGCLAIVSEWNTKSEVQQMNQFAQAGMSFYQDALQNLAWSMIHHQAAIQDARDAQILQHDAVVWLNQSLADEQRAAQLYNKSKQLTKVIKQDEIDAYNDRNEAQHEEDILQDHLHKLHSHQVKQQQIKERTVAWSPSSILLCHRSGFRTMCDLIGGVTKLREMAELEAMAIQSEYNQVLEAKTRKDQLFEEANALEMEAMNYSRIEHQLWRQAEELHFRAQRETVAAFLDVVFEGIKEEQAIVEEVIALGEAERFQKEAVESHALFRESLKHACRAYVRAMLGIVFGVLVFGLCILITAPNLHDTCQLCIVSLSSISLQRPVTFRGISYCALHVLIFFYMVSMFHLHWENAEEYDIRQRGDLVLIFAILASFVQTALLQTLPCFVLVISMIQVTNQVTLTFTDVAELLWNDLKRGIFLTILFGGELLITWVLFGPSALYTVVCVLPWWISTLVLIFIAGAHVYYLELCPLEDDNDAVADDVTVGSEESIESSSSASSSMQVSALTGEPASETDSLLNKYWSSAGGSQASARSLISVSLSTSSHSHNNGATNSNNHFVRLLPRKYQTNFMEELVNMVLLLDLLIMACMVAVFITCSPVFWNLRHLYLREYW